MLNWFTNIWHALYFYPFFLPFVVFVIILYNVLSRGHATKKNLPPSPPKLPIIGNLHQLSASLHRDFLSLSRRYGKLMLLHLGSRPTVVVSSIDAVREIMKTHDVIFSNRPKSGAAIKIFYDYKDVAFAPYGDYWRQMKSVCVTQLLSNKKVQSFRNIREEETGLMVEMINESHSSVINLSEIIVTYTYDVICRATFGRKYCSNRGGGVDFKELLNEAIELLGVFSLGEFIPWLSWVDRVKGLDGRVQKVADKLDEFLETVIREPHTLSISVECNMKEDTKNFVDILLEYQNENKDAISIDCIKAVILDMFSAGTETTFTLLEWMMSELIRHPRVMKKLREEIRSIVGGKDRRVCEDDLEKLIYLKAVMKEALRLHPPAPLLLFRQPSQDVKINGFDITAGTQVIINAWAIQRDPTVWENPEEFYPERFLKGNATIYDFKGQDFQFIPFGAGRRMCPGTAFAVINAELVAANLVYEFDWKLPDGAECGKLDMAESVGITIHRRVPLMVIATPYSCK